MQRYILMRLSLAIPTILGAVTLVFFAMQLAPGDPASLFIPPDLPPADSAALEQRINDKYGFDDPLPVQYGRYVANLLTLNLGESLREGTLISNDLKARLPHTLRLGIGALLVSTVLGIALGLVSAIFRGTWIDRITMLLALVGVSIPSYWLAFSLILLLSIQVNWLPPSGLGATPLSWDGIKHLIMPVLVLSLGTAGALARYTRASMLDVINRDYVRTARAKGVRERSVMLGHAFRNALVPVVTILGLNIGFVLSGAVIVETVFALPGIGRYLVDGVNGRDFPVVQASVLVIATAFVLGNLLTDILIAYLDPRIRFE